VLENRINENSEYEFVLESGYKEERVNTAEIFDKVRIYRIGNENRGPFYADVIFKPPIMTYDRKLINRFEVMLNGNGKSKATKKIFDQVRLRMGYKKEKDVKKMFSSVKKARISGRKS
jgi:hypothetical protein